VGDHCTFKILVKVNDLSLTFRFYRNCNMTTEGAVMATQPLTYYSVGAI
jgi:hypothetical protein